MIPVVASCKKLEGDNMIKVEDLQVSYYGKMAISNVNFKFEDGVLVGIVGPNGAGKSTMIKAILGLISKDKGKIIIDGKSIKDKRKDVAYVPQRSSLDWDFPINVFDTVLMGTYPSLGMFKKPKAKEKELAKESLERMNMIDYAERQISELSGGQQQRVFIARALAQKADIFFLDEPFVGIDAASEREIIDMLRKLKDEGKIIFVVNHDLSKIESYFDDLILINKDLFKVGKVEDVFTYENITEVYETDFGFSMMSGKKSKDKKDEENEIGDKGGRS